MGISNGYTYNLGTIWNTSSGSDGIRIFYLETEQVHSTNSDDRARPRLQEVGRYYYKIDRPTKVGANGTKET
jgi:hypothetical protein